MKRPKSIGKPLPLPNRPVDETDGLLEEIQYVSRRKDALERRAAAELEAVRARYQAISECSYLLTTLDQKLRAHLRRNRKAIFQNTDKRRLAHGTVYFGRESRISIPKSALGVIKEQGWRDGLKITETLNRAVVEKWPADRLEIIGARRKTTDKYSYDLERWA